MKAKTFKGGIHPHDCKHYSNKAAVEDFPAPEKVIIHLSQHIGAPALPIVKKNDVVKKGQKIAEAGGFVSIPMHSPISGKVIQIAKFPHPTGTIQQAIEIENDGKDEWFSKLKDEENYFNLSVDEMKNRIKNAGICGMGGAGFPTHVKLSPPENKPIDMIILNGVECEPYLTSDHRLMLERPEEIIAGLKLIMKIVSAKRGFIGIELNKKDAINLMKEKLKNEKNLNVVPLKLRYPQGAEKQLIYAATKRKVPAGGLPMDIGAVVQNVGTAFAIYESIRFQKPLINRITTVTGDIVKTPKNLRVPIGSSMSEMLDFCGGTNEEIGKLISGGPMMGFALPQIDTPISKTSSGIVFLSKKDVDTVHEQPCLRCGRCVDACPMNLVPTFLAETVRNGMYEEAKKMNINDCIECGSCSFVCPSHIQIVQWIKVGKLEVGKLAKKANEK
ncbi:MAG: electron transport complex subunit RsxC [Candidatus Cloacimonadota bacterium]|nr:electron transport complex subunit RsxC [Candidatus Cloacimonadota bacterium]